MEWIIQRTLWLLNWKISLNRNSGFCHLHCCLFHFPDACQKSYWEVFTRMHDEEFQTVHRHGDVTVLFLSCFCFSWGASSPLTQFLGKLHSKQLQQKWTVSDGLPTAFNWVNRVMFFHILEIMSFIFVFELPTLYKNKENCEFSFIYFPIWILVRAFSV